MMGGSTEDSIGVRDKLVESVLFSPSMLDILDVHCVEHFTPFESFAGIYFAF